MQIFTIWIHEHVSITSRVLARAQLCAFIISHFGWGAWLTQSIREYTFRNSDIFILCYIIMLCSIADKSRSIIYLRFDYWKFKTIFNKTWINYKPLMFFGSLPACMCICVVRQIYQYYITYNAMTPGPCLQNITFLIASPR